MTPKTTIIQKYNGLTTYFILAYLISWLIWLPLVLSSQKNPMLHALGFMGPMIAALIITGATQGWAGIKHLLAGLTKYRVGGQWYLFVLLVPPLLFLLSVGSNYLFTQTWPNFSQYGRLNDLFPRLGLGATTVLHFIIVGFGEEVGWRGFALPRLQSNQTSLRATLLLSVLWGFWHLPTFLFDNNLLVGLGISVFLVVITFPVAVIYTWLYNSTGGSLLIVSLWSTSTTLALGSLAAIELIPIIMGGLIVVLAMFITNLAGPENLSRTGKVTIDTTQNSIKKGR